MTAEKYLICDKCKKYVYACKNGRLEDRKPQINDIAYFIEKHEFDCDGNIQVWDEGCMPPDDCSYSDCYGKGRKD